MGKMGVIRHDLREVEIERGIEHVVNIEDVAKIAKVKAENI